MQALPRMRQGCGKDAARGQWLGSGSGSKRGPSKRGAPLDVRRRMSLAPSLWLGGTVISIVIMSASAAAVAGAGSGAVPRLWNLCGSSSCSSRSSARCKERSRALHSGYTHHGYTHSGYTVLTLALPAGRAGAPRP